MFNSTFSNLFNSDRICDVSLKTKKGTQPLLLNIFSDENLGKVSETFFIVSD